MSRRAWVLMAGTAALWGSSYLFIKLALEDDLSAGAIVCLRTALGAAVLVPLAQRRRALGAAWDHRRWLAFVALVRAVVPFLLITLGERHIASSLAGILVAAAPLWNALAPPFAVLYGTAFLGEAIGPGALAGIVLILAGSWLGAGGALSRSGPSRSSAPAPARAR